MINLKTVVITIRILAINATLLLPLLGQIIQDHPELCGSPNAFVAVPKGVSGVAGDGEFTLSVSLNDSVAKIPLLGVEELQEVCPLANGRLLVFGWWHDPAAEIIYLIDSTSGRVLDTFTASNPAVSPDQHWLAMREWVPMRSFSVGSEQYYIYDLTKDAAGNRFPGVDYRYVRPLGRTLYPVASTKHLPFETDVSREEGHSFEGGAFIWSSDSKSVVFLDRTPLGVTCILVRIVGDSLNSYIHRLNSKGCTSVVKGATFGIAAGGAAPDVQVEFLADCPPLYIAGHDFKPAPLEIPKPVHRRPSVQVKNP